MEGRRLRERISFGRPALNSWEIVIETGLVAIGLAMDAFAVSLAASVTEEGRSWGNRFQMAFAFGLFQALMPVLGWLLGRSLLPWIEQIAHLIACAILLYVGGSMCYSSLKKEESSHKKNLFELKSLLGLAFATSIDAFAIGLGYAMLRQSIFWRTLAIGLVTFGLCLCAFLIGGKMREKLGKRMELVGGILLIGLGLKIVIERFV